MNKYKKLQKLSKLLRYLILVSTTQAGSGHATSSLSATDLMTVLFFDGFFRKDLNNFQNPNNDKLIFSKGHASPLLYALYAASGAIGKEELLTLRKFGSRLEGHPALAFPFTEAATGSLGQGLSIGVGMALRAKYIDTLSHKIYVLLGDSEMAEGSVWEAMQIASHYKLDNIIAVVDVNRLGQSTETMYGHDIGAYQKRISAFGWHTICIDGHDMKHIHDAFKTAQKIRAPVAIIAKTIKGKGVSFLEDKEGWHGKPLGKEDLKKALEELGPVDKTLRETVKEPKDIRLPRVKTKRLKEPSYTMGEFVATRKGYGNALARIFPKYPNMVVLDAEVSNSTYSEIFKKQHPERYFEMYIAEQNMVGVAIGLARVGKIPFISTFAAFFSRAFDQIRMSQYSKANIKCMGSHAGVFIGEDGPSQMGLEDIAMFRSILESVVLYPSDAVSCERLVEEAAKHEGLVYIRAARKETPVLYSSREKFPIGKSKVLRSSNADRVTIVGAGVTVHEALAAYEKLNKEHIRIRVIDLYSIKPLDIATLKQAAKETKAIVVVEDHYPGGGIGEAVAAALKGAPVHSLAVRKKPKSGKPHELLAFEEISEGAIRKFVHTLL